MFRSNGGTAVEEWIELELGPALWMRPGCSPGGLLCTAGTGRLQAEAPPRLAAKLPVRTPVVLKELPRAAHARAERCPLQ